MTMSMHPCAAQSPPLRLPPKLPRLVTRRLRSCRGRLAGRHATSWQVLQWTGAWRPLSWKSVRGILSGWRPGLRASMLPACCAKRASMGDWSGHRCLSRIIPNMSHRRGMLREHRRRRRPLYPPTPINLQLRLMTMRRPLLRRSPRYCPPPCPSTPGTMLRLPTTTRNARHRHRHRTTLRPLKSMKARNSRRRHRHLRRLRCHAAVGPVQQMIPIRAAKPHPFSTPRSLPRTTRAPCPLGRRRNRRCRTFTRGKTAQQRHRTKTASPDRRRLQLLMAAFGSPRGASRRRRRFLCSRAALATATRPRLWVTSLRARQI
mmetsp:Transcript_84396/g.243608  ORF Transcript_84396/g.243608 Transcript_84396/m.243608 type:complete len:317 (-) Transcript_84396:1614-2564(-)